MLGNFLGKIQRNFQGNFLRDFLGDHPRNFLTSFFLGNRGGSADLWVVYKQFPGIRGELQGGVLEGFDLIFGKFSVNFPDEFSTKFLRKIPLESFKGL